MVKNILYIGRFQPFHAGHADAVRQIIQKSVLCDGEQKNVQSRYNIFIGIGSAETNFTPSNPLTAGERFEIIDMACQEIIEEFKNIKKSVRFHIVPIRNIDHYALWPTHVQQYLPPVHEFYSGSPLVRQLWKNTFALAKIFSIQKNIDISGTAVREKITNQDTSDDMNHSFLPSTLDLLSRFNVKSRLQNMETY